MSLVCTKCGIEKDEGEFAVDKNRKTGRHPTCKLCKNQYDKAWRKANPDEAKNKSNNWKAANIEKVNDYNKSYRKENAKKIKEVQKAYHIANKEKRSEKNKTWRKEHPEQVKATRSAWTKNNPRKLKSLRLKKYGITADDYDAISAEQNGVCAICKDICVSGNALAVDHCHETGKVRGLLCGHCNTGLGKFRDDIDLLKIAIDYLIKSRIP